MKSLQDSVCNHCVLGHYWRLLFNIKNKTGYLKIMLLIARTSSMTRSTALQCLKVCITKSKQV